MTTHLKISYGLTYYRVLVLIYICISLRTRGKRNEKRKRENIFCPLFKKVRIFLVSHIHYESTQREQVVIHTFAHLIVVSLISFLHIVRSNSLRIHHSDKSRRAETRRHEVRSGETEDDRGREQNWGTSRELIRTV
jgi:predicted MPP superfamily phosphohydrolase